MLLQSNFKQGRELKDKARRIHKERHTHLHHVFHVIPMKQHRGKMSRRQDVTEDQRCVLMRKVFPRS